MRRGRPTKAGGQIEVPKPSPSPLRGGASDPFTALDSAPKVVPDAVPVDDASIRYPPLDEFSLLHDSGSKFAFDPKSEGPKKAPRDISQRVTDALADEAFAQPKSIARASGESHPLTRSPRLEAKGKPGAIDTATAMPTSTPQQAIPERPAMVSTGTMTSPSPPSPGVHNNATSNRPPIFRFPSSSSNHRSSSQPRAYDASELAASNPRFEGSGQTRPNLLDHRSRSQILTLDGSKQSQPSFDGSHRSSYLGGLDNSIHRSKSANSKPRPTSVQAPSKPTLLRRLSRDRARPEEPKQDLYNTSYLTSARTGDPDDGEEAVKIDSNVDFLKAMEEEDATKRKEKRLSSGSKHIKRASMPAVSLSGTKSLLAGRFGEAFRRFETNTSGSEEHESSRSPVRGTSGLTPIAGSEATDGRSDDGNDLEESEEIPPEMRRELERRRLSQEEKRVADAAAAYRQRLSEKGGDRSRGRAGGGQTGNKAASIQSKVQSLLDESGRASPSPTKTTSGYGRFTERSDSPTRQRPQQSQTQHPPRNSSLQITSKQPSNGEPSQLPPRPMQQPDLPPTNALPLTSVRQKSSLTSSQPTITALPRHSTPPSDRTFQRPPGPPRPQPKPHALRTGDQNPQSPIKLAAPLATRKSLPQQPQPQLQPPPPKTSTLDGANDDWETNFSKRYPDLSGLQMIETEIDSGGRGTEEQGRVKEIRIRDV